MRFFRKICFVVTLLLLAMPMVAATANGVDKSEKKVWQDSDPSKENYFNNRRALVGPGCTINSIGDGVQVVSGTANLQNLCNENMDDYATIPALVGATVVASPIISVKDNQHYYAGGTEAGFVICAKSDASILTLDLAKFYKIQFLKDGEKVGDLQKISTGKSVTGLGLSLLTIPGSDQVNKLYTAKAPGNFDEIKLVQYGVDANVLSAINIKYAFVGKAREYTITNNKENGIAKYAQEQGRKNITLDCDGVSHLVSKKENVIDEELANSFDINGLNLGLVQLGSRPIKVIAKPSDNQEAFPANTEVGFKYASSALLNLKLGDGICLTFFNKEGTEIGHKIISTTVLGLGLIKKSTEAELVMKAPWDFSAVKLSVEGLNAGLTGTNKVYYAFVRMAPDAASHHCPINATSSRDVSGSVNQFQLQHNDTIQVEWSIVDCPTGSNVKLNTQTGLVSNLDISGKYVFKATVLEDEGRSEKCYELTTLNYAPTYVAEEHGVNILVNNEGESKYVLSDKLGGGLIQIFDKMMNRSAILTTSLNDFTYRQPGVELAANKGLVGIKTADGSNFADGLNGNTRAFNGKMKVGFVVSAKATGLDANVLKLYNIKLYNKGKEVSGGVTTHWDAISAGLIGKEETRKMCLNVEVPAGCVFDEIVLYNTDVLSANLSQLNIYYAYVADAEADNATTNPVYGAQVVSTNNTNASIDFANTKMFSVANIGNGYDELGNLVDESLDTYLTLPLGVDLGGSTISVNMGKVVDKGQQLVMVTQNLALGLGASLGEGLKLTTYLDGAEQEELTSWKVLGADVIGNKGDSYAVLNPSKSFDQVRITPVKALSALENLQIKGFALRTDMNDDGTINGSDNLLVLDENKTLAVTKSYTGAKMLLHRTFTKNADNDKKGWNSIILPVDMTAAQVKEAFGEGVQMAKFDRLENNWIKFSTVNVAADGVVLHKNTPYIIYPTKEPLGNYSYTIDGVTEILDGHVYVANGINYDDQTSELTHTVSGGGMTYTGSYSNPTTVSADSYMFSKGDLIHTKKPHDVKAYRCWLKDDMHTGRMLMFSINGNGIDGTTGIHVIEENKQNTNTGIYNLGGVRMNTNNVDKLPKGVYVVDNKVVVKK